MVPTSHLIALAESAGVAVEWMPLTHRPALYVCEYRNTQPIIILSDKLIHTEPQLRSYLVHELGHHFTSAGELAGLCVGQFIRSKSELRANKWAARTLIRAEWLEAILREGGDPAEELQVEPWLVEVAYKIYWPQLAA